MDSFYNNCTFFIYGHISPYFGKYPIDYDYKHAYGFAKKVIPIKYNNHFLLGKGNFVEVTGKPKNGNTPLAMDYSTGYTPRPYAVVKLNIRGGATWARNKYYDGHISDIASKNDDSLIQNLNLKCNP